MLEIMVSLHSHVTRLGVLDIGSNTVHMLIVDGGAWRRPEPEASTKSTVRLMQYLKADGTIKKAGVEAVVAAVEKAMGLVKEYEITQLLVLATSALRDGSEWQQDPQTNRKRRRPAGHGAVRCG